MITMQYLKRDSYLNIFKKKQLINNYLKDLLNEFWFVPCDALLRAPELAIWQNIELKGPTLNIGCGDGRIDKFLFKGKKINVSIDYDKKAIEIAKTSGLYGKTICASASNMPFDNNSFNTIISNSTFEHIKRDLSAVNEVYRVLKKGGSFLFTTTNDRFPNTMRIIGLSRQRFKIYNQRVNHFHYRSETDWKDILTRTGFSFFYIRSYLPDKWMSVWWILFKLSTWKIYRRELWSYLKDSPYGKIFPKKVISKILYFTLLDNYKKSFQQPGNWLFIYAIK